MGNAIGNIQSFDIFEGVSEEDKARILAKCTPIQRSQLTSFGNNILCGLLFILGSSGTGKTIALCTVGELQLCAGKKLLAMAVQNIATENLRTRMEEHIGISDDILNVRMWAPNLELLNVTCCGSDSIEAARFTEKNFRFGKSFSLEASLAGKVLMLCGLLPTTNKKILTLRASGAHSKLITILTDTKDTSEETIPKEHSLFFSLIMRAFKDILVAADVIATTLT